MNSPRLSLMSEVKRGRMKTEMLTLKLPEGTLARAENLLAGGEMRADMFREAIERELVRRERLRIRDSVRSRAPAAPS